MPDNIPGKCSRRFWGIFEKILGNASNFKLIKARFYLRKANVQKISEAWPAVVISNERIDFFKNSNLKELLRP